MWWWWLACGAPQTEATSACATGDCRTDIASIAVGDEFGCALRHAGTLSCWGRNRDGQLGTGSFAEFEGSHPVLRDALSVSAGARHACAVRVGGTVACWGENDREQVSHEAGDWSGPRNVALNEPAVEVAAGWTSTCARTGEGAVWCWGDDVALPRRIPEVKASRLANGRTSCAIEADGDVICWQGLATQRVATGAEHVAVDREVVTLSDGRISVWEPGQEVREVGRVAGATALAVVRGGVYVASRSGELWGFSSGDSPVPLPVGRGESVAGRGHSACALTEGRVHCWGPGAAGLGPRGILRPQVLAARGRLFAGGATTCVQGDALVCYDASGPRVVALGAVAALALGDKGQWLARPDGTVAAWSRDGTVTPVDLPADQLEAGDGLVCSREAGGIAWCAEQGAPATARPMGARAVAVGGRFACAVSGAGEVGCWEGAEGAVSVVAGLPPISQIAVGANLACAAEGGVWCWNHWRAGLGAATAPVAVGVANPAQIAVGLAHGCALTEDGAVWCWGANERGQLGDGTTRGRTAAVKVQLPERARRVDLGHSHSCAELVDDRVACWGYPSGLGERLVENAPDQVVRAPID